MLSVIPLARFTEEFFADTGYRAQLVDKVVGRNGNIKINVHPTYVGFDLLKFPDNVYPVLTDQHTLDEQRIKSIWDLQYEPRVIEVVRLLIVP